MHNNFPFLLEALPAALTGMQSLCQFQGKVTTAHFYYKPATSVDSQKPPAVPAEKTGQITTLTYGILSA